jgi:hypothetical protein
MEDDPCMSVRQVGEVSEEKAGGLMAFGIAVRVVLGN